MALSRHVAETAAVVRYREDRMTVTMYHNPRCSKSRQTLKLLQEKGVEPRIVEYLKTPPDAKTLKSILKKLGIEPRALMRRKEAPYKELNLADPALGEDALIESMVENPILIERPIVLANDKAALGRPPEKVLDIL
jgi:arsenate reductase